MTRYLPSTDRSTTVDPKRFWSPIGPSSTTNASLGHNSWNSYIKEWDKILSRKYLVLFSQENCCLTRVKGCDSNGLGKKTKKTHWSRTISAHSRARPQCWCVSWCWHWWGPAAPRTSGRAAARSRGRGCGLPPAVRNTHTHTQLVL